MYFRFLTAAILDFRLPVTCDNHLNSTVGLADPENTEVAVGISFLSGIEPEIHWFQCTFLRIFVVLPVSGRHIGILAGAGLVMSAPTRSPAIFRKSYGSISVKSQWF